MAADENSEWDRIIRLSRAQADGLWIGPGVIDATGAHPDWEAVAACTLCKDFCTGACDDEDD